MTLRLLTFASLFLGFAELAHAECVAVGRAAFDRACYGFTTREQCNNPADRPACRWLQSDSSQAEDGPGARPDQPAFRARAQESPANGAAKW
jgi:hypothetical protein